MVLELHLPDALQQVPNVLPAHVSFTSGPQRPSTLTLRPVWDWDGVG